ncbi:hypothetical protein KTT_15240 [Tengunoibacter tsumagoiensis]|uniref:Uncharacterized protein n=1 Tax=Tengunoibacter tsumagoiensis TaxID=2014871 RepID=A0A401ZXV8_9CHLR|nr:hypothetical protein KTT_15240 [Tengunoibacter tsumagoiensis]
MTSPRRYVSIKVFLQRDTTREQTDPGTSNGLAEQFPKGAAYETDEETNTNPWDGLSD